MRVLLEKLEVKILSVYRKTIAEEGRVDLIRWLNESDFFVAPALPGFMATTDFMEV